MMTQQMEHQKRKKNVIKRSTKKSKINNLLYMMMSEL